MKPDMKDRLLVLVILAAFCFPCAAQVGAPVGNAHDACSKKEGYHLDRALHLITNREQGLMRCAVTEAAPEERDQRLEEAIRELQIALVSPLPSNWPPTTVKLFLAGAHIDLARTYLEKGRGGDADRSMDDAASIYRDILRADSPSELVARIVAGMLRAGKPLEALHILAGLPTLSSEQQYLQAEAFFSMGDRDQAADAYERWIEGGCKSDFPMLAGDAYGYDQRSFAVEKEQSVTMCQQLPAELRTRLEDLRWEFGHPKNMPKKNIPPLRMPLPD